MAKIITYNGLELNTDDCVWIEVFQSYWPNIEYCKNNNIHQIPQYCDQQEQWFVLDVGSCILIDPDYNEGVSITSSTYCVNVSLSFDEDIMVLEYIFEDDGVWYEDNRWINSEALNDSGVFYRDCCDDYVHEEDSCGCGNDDDDDFERFDFKRKINSSTYIQTCGMQYTFGVEIETTSGGYITSDDAHDANLSLAAVYDGSISGAEYVTGVLQGDKGVDMLHDICSMLSETCSVNKSCGLHVHIGGFNDNRRFSLLALRLGVMIENELYSMMPDSRKQNSFCKPVGFELKELTFGNIKKVLADYVFSANELNQSYNKKRATDRYTSQRYRWLNLVNCNSSSRFTTIEFRQHSGTTSFEKVYNWTLICMSFVNFVENQPSRIMKGDVTLQEVVRYSLRGQIGDGVIAYIKSRYEKFGNKFTLEHPSFHNLSKQKIDNINEFLKQLNNVEKQREVFRAKNGRVFSA